MMVIMFCRGDNATMRHVVDELDDGNTKIKLAYSNT